MLVRINKANNYHNYLENLVLPCDPNPCFNGGTCVPSDDPKNPTCICPNEFIGPRCETRGINVIRFVLIGEMNSMNSI